MNGWTGWDGGGRRVDFCGGQFQGVFAFYAQLDEVDDFCLEVVPAGEVALQLQRILRTEFPEQIFAERHFSPVAGLRSSGSSRSM